MTQRAAATAVAQPPHELELVGPRGRRDWVEVREAPVVEDEPVVRESIRRIVQSLDREIWEAISGPR